MKALYEHYYFKEHGRGIFLPLELWAFVSQIFMLPIYIGNLSIKSVKI